MDKKAMNENELNAVSGGTILPYQVQPGDTMASIAARYNVTVEQVAKWNNIQNPDSIQVGQQLKIKF